jgi:hypothetical protein
MTNEETLVEFIRIANELKSEFKNYTNELKTYVDGCIETCNKISVDHINSVMTHTTSLDAKFDSYVSNITENLEAHNRVNLERSNHIVASNKLIAAASLSPHFGDPIAELNKLIGVLK